YGEAGDHRLGADQLSLRRLDRGCAAQARIRSLLCEELLALPRSADPAPDPARRALAGGRAMIGLGRFLRHRYDYRAEWLRFTRTMGQGGSAGEALPERAIRAIAEMTESAGGLLFMPEQDGTLVLAARWRWPAIEVRGAAFPIEFALEVERTGRIVDIGDARGETEPEILPKWLAAAADAWALVPLLHLDRLHGVIVLAHPSVPRQLDREDVDLLGIVGRQLASYLAERAGQEALMEARQFDEFSRRIAFVMHDVKNLASQLSLLARNAE